VGESAAKGKTNLKGGKKKGKKKKGKGKKIDFLLSLKYFPSLSPQTFTKWLNSHLRKRGPSSIIENVQTDFSDGLKLITFLEVRLVC
jgi:hypothetical protein